MEKEGAKTVMIANILMNLELADEPKSGLCVEWVVIISSDEAIANEFSIPDVQRPPAAHKN